MAQFIFAGNPPSPDRSDALVGGAQFVRGGAGWGHGCGRWALRTSDLVAARRCGFHGFCGNFLFIKIINQLGSYTFTIPP